MAGATAVGSRAANPSRQQSKRWFPGSATKLCVEIEVLHFKLETIDFILPPELKPEIQSQVALARTQDVDFRRDRPWRWPADEAPKAVKKEKLFEHRRIELRHQASITEKPQSSVRVFDASFFLLGFWGFVSR